MNDGMIWLDGRLVDGTDATLSAFDHGVTVGDGIFESMKVVVDSDGPHAFAATRHLARLRRSAALLGFEVSRTDDELRAAILAVMTANGSGKGEGGRVRLTVTGGVGPLGSDRAEGACTVIVATSPRTPWPESAAVATVPWRRNEFSPVAGAKTTSYAENVVALAHAKRLGAHEAIFANTVGNLCEGTGTNIFVGIRGRLITPPLSSGCLAGVTRELLVEILDVDEENLPISALAEADEAFLTSSTRDVQPISTVDGVSLVMCPGPLTIAAASGFAALEAGNVDP